MAVIPRNTTSVFKGFGWRIILDRFYYRCYFNDAAGHYLNYVPCGQSVYTREHAAAAHPWDMYPRHFHACANVAILSLLYVPAARPCYISPQCVLHTFCRCMSLQHVAATCPALNIPMFSYGPGLLPCMGYISMCGPKGYGFSAILVINRVSILADLGHFGLKWGMVFVLSSHDMGMILSREATSLSLSKRKSTKAINKLLFVRPWTLFGSDPVFHCL